jgi:hypothetical protein
MQMPGFDRSARLLLLAFWSCTTPSIARAQSDSTSGHRGLHFALEGAAATTVGACSGCTGLGQSGTEYAFMLRVGGAVVPRVVLSGELDVWDLDRGRGSESAEWELVAAQYYPSVHRGLYVSAGIGLAQFQDEANGVFDERSTRNALGVAAGVGYDLHLSGAFFLTPSIDVLYAQPLASSIGVRRAPAVIRAGISVVREPHGEIAHEESKKGDGHRGLEVALGVGEGIKPASCAGCAGWGGPAGGTVYLARAGWAVSRDVVVSADVTGWQRGVGRANESVVWQMITTQYYPNPRRGLYVDAGVGRAVDDFHVDGFPYLFPPVVAATTHTLGLSIGIGYEDSPHSFFSMTPSLNVLYAMPQREPSSPPGVRIGTILIYAGITLAWR